MGLTDFIKPIATFSTAYIAAIMAIVAIKIYFGFQHSAFRMTAILLAAMCASFVFIQQEHRLPSLKEGFILLVLSLPIFLVIVIAVQFLANMAFVMWSFVAQSITGVFALGIVYLYGARSNIGRAYLEKLKRE